ncbi:hypothetical protein [Alkalibacillus salilacus]|uniref:DUF4306 domain-containing protein n=1 Tax=Alkalibacillus salilacus TaxID=284582 RepID=A0ABT9VGB7_9BACI|nr:hypothetical protein [Alkalibacillus salilacus]MDQ0160015.1 hypothetical protein [Alkalibacillus salilacus]
MRHWRTFFLILGMIALLIIFSVSALYSLFVVNQIAILPLSDCRPLFIFTPETVEYCSEIYLMDAILLSFRYPTTYLALLAAGGFIYMLIQLFRRQND